MPQNGLNYDGRRGATRRHSTRRDSYRVPFTGLFKGAVAHNGWPAAATESKPAGTVNGAEPPCVVNGDVNHWYQGKSAKAATPRTLGKQGGSASAGRGAPSPRNSEQMAPQIVLSATAKNPWRRRTSRHGKRNTAASTKNPPLPLMPPREEEEEEEEDWEHEIQVTLTDSENNGIYGPQDVIHFSLRDLTLQQRDRVDLPVTDGYSPAVHHPRPISWRCYSVPTEQDQYADADE